MSWPITEDVWEGLRKGGSGLIEGPIVTPDIDGFIVEPEDFANGADTDQFFHVGDEDFELFDIEPIIAIGENECLFRVETTSDNVFGIFETETINFSNSSGLK